MGHEIKPTRFEQELLRHLRALPFDVQQHISRYIIKLQREHGVVPEDPMGPRKPGEPAAPLWNMTHDELAKMRKEIEGEDAEEELA